MVACICRAFFIRTCLYRLARLYARNVVYVDSDVELDESNRFILSTSNVNKHQP